MNIMKSFPVSMKTQFAAIPVVMALTFGMASSMTFAEGCHARRFSP